MSWHGLRTREELELYAQERGLVVRYPKPNELFIDIDSQQDMDFCLEQMKILREKLGVQVAEDELVLQITPSRSNYPGKFHVVLTFPEYIYFSWVTRIAFQAMLGSDRQRELLSWFDAGHAPGTATVFFEKKP